MHRAATSTGRGDGVPVGETEFAQRRDVRLRGLEPARVRRREGRRVEADVQPVAGRHPRAGARRRACCASVSDGGWVVVNAEDYADLERVVAGRARRVRARASCYRTGPSFVRALAGLEPSAPLTAADIWPTGAPTATASSSSARTSGSRRRQVDGRAERCGLIEIELDVNASDRARDAHVARRERVIAALARRRRRCSTRAARWCAATTRTRASRSSRRGLAARSPRSSARALAARPGWVIAKGGITSHDVAVHGLGIRRAEVLGQLLPGMVSVFRPIEAAPDASACPTSSSPATSATSDARRHRRAHPGADARAPAPDLLRARRPRRRRRSRPTRSSPPGDRARRRAARPAGDPLGRVELVRRRSGASRWPPPRWPPRARRAVPVGVHLDHCTRRRGDRGVHRARLQLGDDRRLALAVRGQRRARRGAVVEPRTPPACGSRPSSARWRATRTLRATSRRVR